jgi:phosphoribosylglycinamide formyltransferase-1
VTDRNRRLAVLLSGRGSNFRAIADAIRAGRLDADIAGVISSDESAPGLAAARDLGLSTAVVSGRGLDRPSYDRLLVEAVASFDASLVCLAGFMRILGPVFLQSYASRVVNIHPSLLPSFPGLHAQRQALEHGVKVAGCTVHLVDEGVDTGPILMQRAVEVLPDDTEESLSARILAEEHDVYWRAIALLLDGKIRRSGRRALYSPE